MEFIAKNICLGIVFFAFSSNTGVPVKPKKMALKCFLMWIAYLQKLNDEPRQQ